MTDAQWMQRADRMARVIAQDLELYCGERLQAAIAEDSLFEAFADEFRDAWVVYRSRLPAHIDPQGHRLRSLLVDAVLSERGHIDSAMW